MIKAKIYISPEVMYPFYDDEDPFIFITLPAVPRNGDVLELGTKTREDFEKKFKEIDREHVGWYWKYFYGKTGMEIEKTQNLNMNYKFKDESFEDFNLDDANIVKQVSFLANENHIIILIGKSSTDEI